MPKMRVQGCENRVPLVARGGQTRDSGNLFYASLYYVKATTAAPRSLLAQFRCLAELDYLNCKCGAQDKEGERGRITLCTAVAAGRTGDMSIMRKYKLHSGTQCKLKRVTHLGDREHQRRKIRLKKHLFRKGCSYSYIMTLQVTYAW